ncbi:MAG: DUF262 domain-containing protein, partial [Chloroflexi bacterium]|nr:DUF262 domain-containing protein [Chloroflexota bacterium]
VPLFQRQYVWSREQQWEPLWEDIERKFAEYLQGRKDGPVHFLGAMVLDQKLTPSTHVERRQVIDGQQRLATLQIFLSACRDFCREQACEELAREFDGYVVNTGMMANPDVDRFKVWPTQLDRAQFQDVITLGSRAAIEKKHPLFRRPYARKCDPRPRMIEAYLFFNDQIRAFFVGTAEDPPLAADQPIAARIEEAFQALKNALQVVAIDLEKDDDAQVIFETLNARGEPLLPADLLRNYIFLRAARLNEPQEQLYDKFWRRFDDEFWRKEVRQGRLIRPRSDLFMQHYLASRQMVDIPIKHLFVEYRFWIEKTHPYKTVADELAALAKQGDNFRRIIEPKKGDCIFGLATFMERFDIRTAYPLLLFLLDANLTENDWDAISAVLESYLLRRAFLEWSTKAYNRIFLNLVKSLQKAGCTPANLRTALSELEGESSAWPADDVFLAAWQTHHAYRNLNNAKIVHMLRRLSDRYLTNKNEQITIDCPLTVEHLLPQGWLGNWPLPSGDKGMTWEEMSLAEADDPRAIATKSRDAALQTIGNLTILTQGLNSSVSNANWSSKKPELLKASLLPINQQLHGYDTWDEDAIQKRGKELFSRATEIWPPPDPKAKV